MSNEQFRLLAEARPKEKAQLAEAIPAPEEHLEDLGSSLAKAKKFIDMTELTLELLRAIVANSIAYEKELKYSKPVPYPHHTRTKPAPRKIHICFRGFNLNETGDERLCGKTTEKADRATARSAEFEDTLQNIPAASMTRTSHACSWTHNNKNYSLMAVTTPEPTVRPPSRIAKRNPSSIAMGVISSISITMLSPGITISTPSGRWATPVTSVVRK